jgi:DNA-binding NarL/FixJ family response regulator
MFTRATPPRTRPAESAKDFSVLIAVEKPSFQRLLEHVVHGDPGLRLVGGSSRRVSPVRQAARLAPNVIILSTRLKGREPGEVLAELKRSCPASTLILLTHALGEPVAPPGADVCLPEDAVVRRLLPMIRKAAHRAADRTPQPASAGPRT